MLSSTAQALDYTAWKSPKVTQGSWLSLKWPMAGAFYLMQELHILQEVCTALHVRHRFTKGHWQTQVPHLQHMVIHMARNTGP